MKIIGHRGAKGLAPENSLLGLQKAFRHGADEAEFDVRVTQDHVPLLHHETAVVNSNGTRLAISEHTYQELRAHQPDLVTLETVFTELAAKPLLMEVKPHEPVEPIIRLLKKPAARGQLAVCSFDQAILRQLRDEFPDLPLVVNERWSGLRATRRARQLGTKRISMNHKWLWWGFIRSLAGRGWQLSAYTLNDPAKAKRWRRHGLYAVITDYPDRFRS